MKDICIIYVKPNKFHFHQSTAYKSRFGVGGPKSSFETSLTGFWSSSDPLGRERPTWAERPTWVIFAVQSYNVSDPPGQSDPFGARATHSPTEVRKIDLSAQFHFGLPPTAFKKVFNNCSMVFNVLVASLMISNI